MVTFHWVIGNSNKMMQVRKFKFYHLHQKEMEGIPSQCQRWDSRIRTIQVVKIIVTKATTPHKHTKHRDYPGDALKDP